MQEVNKNKLREISNKYDLAGIYMDKEVNFNEYDPEINFILKGSKDCANLKDFEKLVRETFIKYFGRGLAFRWTFNKLAKKIYPICKK